MPIEKANIPSPYEKSPKTSQNGIENPQAEEIRDPQSSTVRNSLYTPQLNWEQYEGIKDRFELSDNEDFSETRDGKIECKYFDVKGKPYRISRGGKKIDCVRRLGEHTKINVVYLPKQLRGEDVEIGDALYLVQDEMQAWVLCELGIAAVGMPRPNSFLTRPTQMAAHKLIKQVIRQHAISKIVYVASPAFLSLPTAEEKEIPMSM